MKHYNLSTSFAACCLEHSERPALHYADETISYAELETRANSLAGLLLLKEIKTGDVVAILSEKKVDAYAMMLGCLQIGVTYVNLDTVSPLTRLEKICSTCKPSLIFADHHSDTLKSITESTGIPSMGPDTMPPENFNISEEVRNSIDGSTIAYIMFTSGSTGMPKGVAVTHQNLLHFISWSRDCYHITSDDNFAQISPLYFDNSVFDFFSTFFTGASLTPISRELLTKPKDLVDFISELHCTIWFSVPSLLVYLLTMKVITGKNLTDIRIFTFGGEGFPKTELQKLFSMYASNARLVNVYGPTECTCICSNWDISSNDFEEMNSLAPLGRLNPNFSCVILDNAGRPADEGELYLLGPNVAAGYYNDPERSALSFSLCEHNPHLLKPQYATGDLVRIDKTENLHFIGRKDNQIKHMGYRIELEEIEAALNSLDEVGQAAVVYKRVSNSYGKIIAYVAPNVENMKSSFVSDIKKQLTSILPQYMIPSKIITLTVLPKNANGKIDRVKLTTQSI
ncbi:MAG: hypothetical protein BA863_18835 [Desulfovibrio sp. S3730MH75]|nr:MAG: hypothetical protein BA863_18835 [Desulfovibrio sp. S3730MH75]